MKLILSADETFEMFKKDNPIVSEVLSNKTIKQITKEFDVVSVFKDTTNTANLNNFVIGLEIKNNGN